MTGKSADLLSYDHVRQQLGVSSSAARRLENIPLDAIVGSVGRYTDFSRSFLPRKDSDRGRLASVILLVDAPATGGTITNTAAISSDTRDPHILDNAATSYTLVCPRHTIYLPLVVS